MTPGQRNQVSNSKERQFYEFRLVLFFECMVPTFQRIIVGNILNNMSVSVKHTSQRLNQRCLCKNKEKETHQKKKNKQGSEKAPGSWGHVLETGVDAAFQSVCAHSLQKFISRFGIWIWVPSGNLAADNFPWVQSRERAANLAQRKGKPSTENMRVTRGKHVASDSHGARMNLGGKWPIQGTLNSDTP